MNVRKIFRPSYLGSALRPDLALKVGRVCRTWSWPYFVALAMAFAISSAARADQADSPSFAYLLHCAGCHLEDGSGDPPAIPDLRTDLGLLLDSPEGRSYVVRVPGITDATLTPEKMAELLTWMVRQFYPDRTDLTPFSAEEVLAGRENPLYDPVSHRNRLLVQLGIPSAGN